MGPVLNAILLMFFFSFLCIKHFIYIYIHIYIYIYIYIYISQLQVSDMSSHTEELWYNETVCLWMTIYINKL